MAVGGFKRARKAALRGFERGLAEMGVPPAAIKQLVSAYPDLDLKESTNRRRDA